MMKRRIHFHNKPFCLLALLVFVSVLVFPSLLVAQRPAGPSDKTVAAITEISVERNCFGCPTGSLLVLRRDGTATYTVTGDERHGTTNQVTQGKVARKDFDRLARLATTNGFFKLAEEYGDPEQRDGPWTALTVVRGRESKKVTSREQAGPKCLQEMIKAVDEIGASIRASGH
jgi:hypothetical protein